MPVAPRSIRTSIPLLAAGKDKPVLSLTSGSDVTAFDFRTSCTRRAEPARRPATLPDSVHIVDPVCIADDVQLQDAEIGPNVSIAEGSRILGGRLRNTIVGADTALEDCDLSDSLVGDHVEARGLKGCVSIGDHSVVAAER